MIAVGVSELEAKTIDKVEVYSDAVLMTLTDGRAAAIFDTQNGLRIQVASRGSEGMPLGVRVYPGDFPYPGTLPESALRRSHRPR